MGFLGIRRGAFIVICQDFVWRWLIRHAFCRGKQAKIIHKQFLIKTYRRISTSSDSEPWNNWRLEWSHSPTLMALLIQRTISIMAYSQTAAIEKSQNNFEKN